MKLYVHDELSEESRVIIHDQSSSGDVNGDDFINNILIKMIEDQFDLKRRGKKLEEPRLLRDEKNKTITKKEQLKDKMDIFIRISSEAIITNVTDEKKPETKQPSSSSSNTTTTSGTSKPSEVPSLAVQKELNKLSESAVKHFQAREYRKAVKAYKSLQAANVDNMGCMSNIATIYIAASKFDRALKYLLKCLEVDKLNQNIYKLLGKCYYGLENYQESLQNFYHQVTILEKYQQEAKDQTKLKDIGELILDGYVDIAKCMGHLSEKKQGFSFIASVLKKNESHKNALLEYAKYVLRETKDASDSITATLRVLVAEQNNADAKDLLSEIVETFGVQPLLNHIGQGAPEKMDSSAAAGLAWMALILKEHSCINEAVVLYKTALKLIPNNYSYLLNLVHTLEIDVRFKEALCEIKDFCKINPTARSGGFSAKILLEFLEKLDLDSLTDPIQNTSTYSQNYYAGEHAAEFSNKTEAKFIDDMGAVFYKKGEEFDLENLKKQVEKRKPKDDNATIDFLAVGFTVVKICYVSGFLTWLPDLIQVLEFERMQRDLHSTQIRNENAYFCTITQLLSGYVYKTLPVQNVDVEKNHIYLVGESHSMTSSYQVINWRQSRYLLLPKLVTGCKCFHLRDNTKFYPKRNYFSVLNSIPKRSTVIFMFGEIDCREGIWVSVERYKYKDIQEGIEKTVSYYMKELQKVSKDFDLFVHPAPPVLDFTRETVKLFNLHLKKECIKNNIRYLDFMGDMLTENGKNLKKELELDNTHCSPNVTKYLEKELNKY